MAWQVLGAVAPSYEWQILNAVPVAGDLIKIEHEWTGTWPGDAVALLGSFYQNQKLGSVRRLLPTREVRMLPYPIPEAIAAAGFTTRNLGIKQNLRGRQVEGNNWLVTVSIWVPE